MTEKIAIVTLGCPKNQVDSEIMAGLLGQQNNLTENIEKATIIVVNTCTFIEAAKEESINTILELAELKETGSCKLLLATGCLAQRYGNELMQEIPELDGILGTGNILEIQTLLEKARMERSNLISNNVPDFIYNEYLPRKRSTPEYYAYVKIAEGCDNYCSYCVIPHVRGRFRSRIEESIAAEVEDMAKQGVKEILLIAQDTTRYGIDLYGKQRLPHLLERLAKIEGIYWIRLMYCYPELFSDELIETMVREPKICRYIDLPLQHANNKVLKEMNRRGTAEQAEDLIYKLREAMPDITIRTTMITGFPGESEQNYDDLVNYVKRIEFDRFGVFAYSQEENTPAGKRNDQIPAEIRESRRDGLMALQQEISLKRQQRWLGRQVKVIIEEELPDSRWLGRTEGDAPEIDGQVYVNTGNHKIGLGDIVTVKILEADSYDLIGEVV